MKSKYMMATNAIHITGDLSRQTPSLCLVTEEEGDNYVGKLGYWLRLC